MVWKDYKKIEEIIEKNGYEWQERAAVIVSDLLLLRSLGENK